MTGETILLVDDEVHVCNIVSILLNRIGFEVLMAMDGARAVDIFAKRSGDIACVLLDFSMPDMDGVRIFEALRAIDENIPVVLSSGLSEEEITQRFGDIGFAGFLEKPYRKNGLYEILGRVLGRDISNS